MRRDRTAGCQVEKRHLFHAYSPVAGEHAGRTPRERGASRGGKKLAEDPQFSDPVSSETWREAETELTQCVAELEPAVVDEDIPGSLELCRKSKSLLAERNRLCNLNK